MILQFTTGSVEDRRQFGINLSVLNAGIQPANIACIFKKFKADQLIEVTNELIKVMPQKEETVLAETGLKDVHCELILKVDSPSLIVTIVGEARYPLHCQTIFVEDVEADLDQCPPLSRSITLLWGYTSKGDPF